MYSALWENFAYSKKMIYSVTVFQFVIYTGIVCSTCQLPPLCCFCRYHPFQPRTSLHIELTPRIHFRIPCVIDDYWKEVSKRKTKFWKKNSNGNSSPWCYPLDVHTPFSMSLIIYWQNYRANMHETFYSRGIDLDLTWLVSNDMNRRKQFSTPLLEYAVILNDCGISILHLIFFPRTVEVKRIQMSHFIGLKKNDAINLILVG